MVFSMIVVQDDGSNLGYSVLSLFSCGCSIFLFHVWCFFSVIVVILVIIIFMKRRRPTYLLDDPDDDIRETVRNYDEEGAGKLSTE